MCSSDLNALAPFNLLKKYFFNKNEFQNLLEEFEESGLKGSNIDVNQVLKRFSDVTDPYNQSTWSKILTLGPVGKTARDWYSGTDDFFKLSVYANEKEKAKQVFDAMSQQERGKKFLEYSQKMSVPIGNVTKDDVIKEIAAKNTANITPVYSRTLPILEKLRTVPVVGNFTAYTTERIRNGLNIIKLGADELREGYATNNSELVKQGF